jgi:hypothetical protein
MSAARHIRTAALLLTAAIHLLPLAGVLGANRLATLYGLPVSDPNLEILLRHRAVLFGLLGVFLIWAAFRPGLPAAGLAAGAVSVVSFLALAFAVGGYNPQLARVVAADLVAAAALAAGIVAHTVERRRAG